MNYFLIFCSLITVAVAQQVSISCNYFYNGATYSCDLTINNPGGFNNFTEIGGIHLEGFANSDVSTLYRVSGASTNVPAIICETFPNLLRIDLYNTGLTEISDDAFGGCERITNLYLDWNSISSITTNAFVNLHDIELIDLTSNLLTTLPENVFASQQSLTNLYLSSNPIDISVGLFRPIENLQLLYLNEISISTVNNQWFTSNTRLANLNLAYNRIVDIGNSFVGLEQLSNLYLSSNQISEIPAGSFAGVPNLRILYLNGNNFTELPAGSFENLGNLETLDIGRNSIQEIPDGAFRGLGNLNTLLLSSCRVRQLNSNSFDGLPNLSDITLNFNEIEELPEGVFLSSPNLYYIGLWANRLKTLRRHSFGTLTNLLTLDLDENIVNAIDRSIIDDAENLSTLYFSGNLCANNYFGNFVNGRAQQLPLLERCFSNMRYIIETTTEGDAQFSFFEGSHPGIALRVNTDNEVQIALTPFNFIWSPVIEIFIGAVNNTRSTIRINEETTVVTVPTPNIITQNQWLDFRVTWANQNVLVYSGNDTFPFMSYTMQYFFPVNFYGLRAVETSALWTVQPL